MAERAGGRGFWRGLFFGLLLGVVAMLALAWIFPPLRAPEVTSDALVAPGAPGAPGGGAAATAPKVLIEGLPPTPASTAAPPVTTPPVPEAAPDLPPGGASLVPPG
jgi:hypothetical protein